MGSSSATKLVGLCIALFQLTEAFQQSGRCFATSNRCLNTLSMTNDQNSKLSNVNSEFSGNNFAKKVVKFGISTLCSLALTSGGFVTNAIAADPVYVCKYNAILYVCIGLHSLYMI